MARMTRTLHFIVAVLALAAIVFQPNASAAQAPSSAALTGIVSSQEEGPMEGVVVSAKREGSTITISVLSNAQGQFSFPRTKLDPGKYDLHIRAVGYDLTDPGPVEVTSQKAAQIDLKLVKTKDLAAQLTSVEWTMSAPGPDEQKRYMANQCAECHTLERIFRSHYTGAEFKGIVHLMSSFDAPSSPEAGIQMAVDGGREKKVSPDYLGTINLSSVDHWQFPLKTLPRPKGEATRVIITEYDLPRAPVTQPHDVTVDKQGIVWYGDFGRQFLGRLDPRTGKVTEYPVPVVKAGFPTGYRVLWLDPQGNIWIAMSSQGSIAKFDPKTEKFQVWKGPNFEDKDINESASMLQPDHLDVDGKVWVQFHEGNPKVDPSKSRGSQLQRLDVRTGEWDKDSLVVFSQFPADSPGASRPHAFYDTVADSHNNVFFTDFESEYIGRVDAKTMKIAFYQTPTFNSGPRRGNVDLQDRFWFGEDRASKIGMLDPETGKIQEWSIPIAYSDSYDVDVDKNGEAWGGGVLTDRLTRINPKTGKVVQYLLPHQTNIRRVQVDNSTNPTTVWFGNTHKSSIVKVEPLE